MKFTLEISYKIGDKIKAGDRAFSVIGYEFIQPRGVRYILLHMSEGEPKWSYYYEFEIKQLQ